MLFLKLIAAAFGLFWAYYKVYRKNNLGKIKFDATTKVSILADQLKILTDPRCLDAERDKVKEYALNIIGELNAEFKNEQNKIDFLNNLKHDLNYNAQNPDMLKPYLKKIWIL